MTPKNKFSGWRLLNTDYDSTADVLHFSVGRSRPTMGKNKGNGVTVRYPLDDPNNACGVTISQFRALGWVNEIGRLSAAIASQLSVQEQQVSAKLGDLVQQIERR